MLRLPHCDMKSGIDYKQSLLNVVDYCENVAIENAPYNKIGGKGYLLSKEEASKVKKFINEFNPYL